MTQRRTGLFWALFAAILAMLLCSVGLAEGSADELSLDGVPESVTLYTDTASPHVSPRGTLRFKAAFKDSNSTISDLKVTLEPKGSNGAIIGDIAIDARPNGDKKVWWVYISYSPVSVGASEYTLTAFTPDNEICRISKDIAFTVVDRIDDLPTKFNISSDYFDENKVYKTVLEMPADGSELAFSLPDEAKPTYTIGGNTYAANFNFISPIDWRNGNLIFKKAGRYQLGLVAAPSGSNWQLRDTVYFVVHSNIPPTNLTPTLTGVPDDDVLIGDDRASITITATDLEQMVNWEVTCDNDEIEVNHWTNTFDDESNLEIRLWGNSTGLSSTVTIKAWYEGYEDDAAIKTFNVHTKEHTFTLSDAPDTVTSYMVDGLPGINDFGCIHIDAFFDDYVSIDKVEFELTKVSGDDIVDFDIDDADSNPDERTSWWINWSYRPIALGTCVYNITASIPGTEYTASKDITFIVTDNADGLPTKLNFSSEYFDDNNVYKGERLE